MNFAQPARQPRERDDGTWHLLVDLSLLRPGGENGGVKQLIFGTLSWLIAHEGSRLTISFLTWSCSHDEVRTLARPWDNLICVREEHSSSTVSLENWRNREWREHAAGPHLAIELGADLIYSPQGSPEFFCPGIPSIATIVDVLHRDYPMTLPSEDVRHRESVFGSLVQTADCFQCISTFTVNRLQTHYHVPDDRVFRNYIAVHSRLALPLAAQISEPEPQNRRPYFFYPANAWTHKNHLTLLVAFGLYQRRLVAAAWDLVLTGHDDARMRAVLETARAMGLSNAVHYRGHLNDEEFSQIWHGAGALAFASLHEGFGIPLVEAMHMGIPILCSAETSLPEIAGDAAVLVDTRDPVQFADAMERISTDKALRQTLVARGQQQLARFSLQMEGEIFLAQCFRLMRRPRSIWARGVHPDGWTDQMAWFSLPPVPIKQIRITVAPMPASRHLRIYRGQYPLGGFNLAANERHSIVLDGPSTQEALVLHAVDALNLNQADHRTHGILLHELTCVLPDGSSIALRGGME